MELASGAKTTRSWPHELPDRDRPSELMGQALVELTDRELVELTDRALETLRDRALVEIGHGHRKDAWGAVEIG